MNTMQKNTMQTKEKHTPTWLTLLCFALIVISQFGCSSQQQSSVLAQDSEALQQVAVSAVLDELHAQAAAANFEAYFALFTNEAVFIGTDRTEYWPIDDFKAYAQPHFSAGNGWTYQPLNRAVHLHERTAWFEEELISAKYGRVRGTGVLVHEPQSSGASVWKVAQYNLTLPIPNSLFDDIAKEIEAHYNAPSE